MQTYPYEEWQVTEEGFSPENMQKNESVFSLGNGFLGLRGNFEEGAGGCGYPTVGGTYLNGFYETEKIRYGEIAYGYAEESQTMLNVADGKKLTVAVEGEEFSLFAGEVRDYRRTLSLRDATLTRTLTWTSPKGRAVRLEFCRLVSFPHPHIAAVRCSVTPVNFGGELTFTSVVDGDVQNLVCEDDPRVGSGLKGRALTVHERETAENGGGLSQRTKNSGLALACAMVNEVQGRCVPFETGMGETRVTVRCTAAARRGETVSFVKYVAYTAGKRGEEGRLLADAGRRAREAGQEGFDALARGQRAYMDRFWERAGVEIEGDAALSQGLRLGMFHLLQSAGKDGKTNISAKGLTGEGYEGHYFWDTETYVLPLFVHCDPPVARQLLTYRYSILGAARRRAREMGHPRGALFPWRTIGGNECSAYYPAGTAQYHINADIAFAVRRYVQCTGDTRFLAECGAEMLAETARLWLNLGFYNPRKGGKFCINGVTGPDEYNAIVDNNCYTNLMAGVNLSYAAEALDILRRDWPEDYRRVAEKIGLEAGEPEDWLRAAENMYVPYDEETGLYMQDDGFLDRVPWPLETIPKDHFPLLLHYHPLVIYRRQVCKQADLILAMYLLGDRFTGEEKRRNFDFYDRITTHDSSLSMATFSVLASELGYDEKAYAYFRGAARLDLDDTHGNTKDGLHMANMAGTWICAVNGFGGMRADGEGLSFRPRLPKEWKGYRFKAQYRGRVVEVSVDAAGARCRLVSGDPITVTLDGEPIKLEIIEPGIKGEGTR